MVAMSMVASVFERTGLSKATIFYQRLTTQTIRENTWWFKFKATKRLKKRGKKIHRFKHTRFLGKIQKVCLSVQQ